MFHLHYWTHELSTLHGMVWMMMVLVMILVLRRLRRTALAFALVALPGTICHEMTHWLIGYLTMGRPSQLVLLPERNGGGYVLGSVRCANIRWYNAVLIGLAPLMLLLAAMRLAAWRVAIPAHPLTLANLLWAYLTACLLDGCIPSSQDLRIAGRSWLLILGLLLLLSGRFI